MSNKEGKPSKRHKTTAAKPPAAHESSKADSQSKGNLIISFDLSKRDAKKMLDAYMEGKLSQFKITSITVLKQTPSIDAVEEKSAPAVELQPGAGEQAAQVNSEFAKRVGKQRRSKSNERE